MVDSWKETYEKKQFYAGHHFTFEILQNNGRVDIGLKPSKIYGLEHQPINSYAVDNYELKKLAEFILNYLENKE